MIELGFVLIEARINGRYVIDDLRTDGGISDIEGAQQLGQQVQPCSGIVDLLKHRFELAIGFGGV